MPVAFKSRAVRALVELFAQEMRAFAAVWEKFHASRLPLPEALGDPSYQDARHLLAHVLDSAHAELNWMAQLAGLGGVPAQEPWCGASDDAAGIRAMVETIADAYRRVLSEVADEDLFAQRRTSCGVNLTLETVLEHAVVHPMRHCIQLERLLDARVNGEPV